MKKTVSILFALALFACLTVTAFAAEVKGEQFTYNLSNEPVGPVDYPFVDIDYSAGGMVDVVKSVYLVPVGTVVSNAHSNYNVVFGEVRDPKEPFSNEEYEAPSASKELTGDKKSYYVGSIEVSNTDRYATGYDEILIVVDSEAYAAQSKNPAPATKPVEQKPAQTAAPAQAGTYTVNKGDTMGKIALNYYGSYGYHKALYKANAAAFKATGGKLVPGMKLTLPEKLGKAARLNAPVANQGEKLYTVQLGDTLGKIAKATYGDPMRYKAIFERNADRLVNANTIYEGQVIVLPAK